MLQKIICFFVHPGSLAISNSLAIVLLTIMRGRRRSLRISITALRCASRVTDCMVPMYHSDYVTVVSELVFVSGLAIPNLPSVHWQHAR
ncbi:hypothetical protein DL93DRAFT_1801579 [Clavulina sp. PMI_390]|nr:hypothetical protein DL93DRAFT_1801579 [Clavulina sp. PMI_390]